MRRGLIWGAHADLVANDGSRSLKSIVRSLASSDEVLSCTVLNEVEMLAFHARLRHFQPQILYGYPSAILQFALFVDERNLAPIKVDTIITTAERLGAEQRGRLERLLGGEVFNLYCTREYGCVGFECHAHSGFHIDTGSVLVEIIRSGRRAEPGQSGEVTITDLINYGMPLVRSRTGDLGTLSPEPCVCGLPLPLLTGLDGRDTDIVYKADGSTVTGLMLADLFADIRSIRAAQFVQNSIDNLQVILVTAEGYSESVERDVVEQVRSLVGRDIAVQVRIVDEISRNPLSGKYREVICNISPPALPGATDERASS
jgi:phenylacetate-CoA ligase